MPKKLKVDPLVSPGTVYYAEKQEKTFCFSFLGQMVQFDTIKFRIIFVELFWSVRVDRKKSHYNSRVSLHEAPTKNRTRDDFGRFFPEKMNNSRYCSPTKVGCMRSSLEK